MNPKPTRRQLRRKHGTPQQFEAAVWQALGEISFREAQEAITKYRREYTKAKP